MLVFGEVQGVEDEMESERAGGTKYFPRMSSWEPGTTEQYKVNFQSLWDGSDVDNDRSTSQISQVRLPGSEKVTQSAKTFEQTIPSRRTAACTAHPYRTNEANQSHKQSRV